GALSRCVVFAAVWAFGLLLALPAFAAGKSVVVYVEGPNSSEVRKQILESVPKTLDVVDPDAFQSALVTAGQKGPVGNVIAIPKMRDKTVKTLRKATENAKADALVVGRVRKAKGGSDEVYLVWIEPGGTDLPVDEAVPLKGSPSDRSSAIKNVLGA